MRKMPRKNTKERRSRVISDESAQSSDDARAQLDKLLDAEQRVLQRIQKLEEREKLLLESCKQLKTNSEPRQRKGNRNRLRVRARKRPAAECWCWRCSGGVPAVVC